MENVFLYQSGLIKESTCAFFAQVQKEGVCEVKRQIPYYNLDIALAVGYRVSSKVATQFRKWATNVLHLYLCRLRQSERRQFREPDISNIRRTGLLSDFGRKSRYVAVFCG